MKKCRLALGIAALVFAACGCSESSKEEPLDCVHGKAVKYKDGERCECDIRYTTDANGICTACAKNYEEKNGNCVRSSANVCQTTFIYKNDQYKGKSIYLSGEFNSWNRMDPNYRFTEYDGVFTLTVDGKVDKNFVENTLVKFKVYVDGLPENEGFRYVEPACSKDSQTCTTSVVCGQQIIMDDNPLACIPDTGAGECVTTFKYYNPSLILNKPNGIWAYGAYLVGSFNEWTPLDRDYEMKAAIDGCYTIQVKHDPAKTSTASFAKCSSSTYKFYVAKDGGQWIQDPYNTNYDKDGNSTADIQECGMTFGYCPKPSGNDKIRDIKYSYSWGDVTLEMKFSEAPVSVKGGVAPRISSTSLTDDLSDYGKYTYQVTFEDGAEAYIPFWLDETKWDWHNALLYFAFTDRFKDGDSSNNAPATEASVEGTSNARWMGGDFKGLQQKVEAGYFDDLGVNTLWISSVSMNTQGISWGTGDDGRHSYSAYHSYWPISAFMTDSNRAEFGNDIKPIEPHFGDEASLKALVDACHKRGIRVLVDFAANHVHRDSPMFTKHKSWFNDADNAQLCTTNNNWDNYPEKCWFSDDLPDINYENAEARSAMVDHAIWLIKKTNIDGFRVDAVKHMNIQFIKDLRAAVNALFKNTGTEFYMVGETFTPDVGLLNKYIGDDLLHAQFDFPLYYKITNVLRGNGFYDLAANYNASFKSDLMGTFMGNHDVARALSVAAKHSEDKWVNNPTPDNWVPYFRVKLAWTILLTRPGVPLIYYGDEVGMPGANDPDNRRMMIFDDSLNAEQKSMLAHVQRLGQIRKDHPATRFGKRRDLKLDNNNWCYLMEKDDDRILVAIATDDGGSGCDLGGTYTLFNLLDPSQPVIETSRIDMSVNKINVFEVQ